jgi:Uma2 family endonuclease
MLGGMDEMHTRQDGVREEDAMTVLEEHPLVAEPDMPALDEIFEAVEALLPNNCYRYQDARLVVEVVSRSSRDHDYGRKLKACALGGIPTYVIVDPKLGTVEVCTAPRPLSAEDAEYGEVRRYRFGDSLVVHDPEVTIDTAEWPRD